MPPGAIGSQRLLRGGPLLGYFQPVEVRVPKGALVSVAQDGGFASRHTERLLVGLQVAHVYRFQGSSLPLHEGVELYPTVELIDRTYPPPGQELRFPIPVELTREDLELALEGMFVTRIVYVEDPLTAEPIARRRDEQPWMEAPQGEDPLIVADQLGRPVAIVRIGGRVPQDADGPASFYYGCPPVHFFKDRREAALAGPGASGRNTSPPTGILGTSPERQTDQEFGRFDHAPARIGAR